MSAEPPAGAGNSLLLTDLYQLNMVQAYLHEGLHDTAVFEFFVRKLPPGRNVLIAAGLEPVVAFLQAAAFAEADLAWLRDSARFPAWLVAQLAELRFTGDVDAVPEGTPVFRDEPLLRVSAPMPQAQLVETRVINLLHISTLAASKAARMRLAAPEARLVDFGLRRAHGAEAGLLAARGAYIGGFDATATVPAEARYGVPLAGTMAHSYVQAHDSETEAFRAFARARPHDAVLLIDTYDTARAAAKVVALAPELAAEGISLRGVRIDSGDLGDQARQVRGILDSGGLADLPIFASGGLDEWKLRALTQAGAPIAGYGVGSALVTSDDAPALDCAYKLQAYAGRPRCKLSTGKATLPGAKQVWRRHDDAGRMSGDVLARAETRLSGTPLLQPVLRGGARVDAAVSLEAARARCTAGLAALPERLRALEPAEPPYTVELHPDLEALAARMTEALRDDAEAGSAEAGC